MSTAQARELLDRLAAAGVVPSGICGDSRTLVAGETFAAMPGATVDGRDHIAEVVARGASAVLWEAGDGRAPGVLPVPGEGVVGLRALTGFIAHEVLDRPSSSMWVAGVTGTNGKTTVSQWIAQACSTLGVRCGVVGTLGCGYPGNLAPLVNTTPDAIALHRMLAGFRDEGAQAVAMEVSSIGLDQGRANGVEFDVALFTNLSRDHLEYHHTMAAYAAAKALLFDLPGLRHAVINIDDDFGLSVARKLQRNGVDVIAYTRANAAAEAGLRLLEARNVRPSPTGIRFTVCWAGDALDIDIAMVGDFNVSNALAVIGALLARDLSFGDAARAVSTLSPPPGRMQLFGGVAAPLVIVDYAHSPDALHKVLEAGRDAASQRGGNLVCVFGCGGDRDQGKRPLMGEVAARLADRVVVTSDNPRSEEPRSIADMVLAGAGTQAACELDRATAIRRAIASAAKDDVVVVAGKGHEPYQEIRGERVPFSDVEQAVAALAAWSGVQETAP